MSVNTEQKTAYEWAKNQNYTSVAARYAKVLAEVVDEKDAENERLRVNLDRANDECYQIDKNAAGVQKEYLSEIAHLRADTEKWQKAYNEGVQAMLLANQELRAELARVEKERDAAVELVAKLVLLCAVPQKECDKVFRRLHIGAGDYMGSGYTFVDAFDRVWDEFLAAADDAVYRLIKDEIDRRQIERQKAEEGTEP